MEATQRKALNSSNSWEILCSQDIPTDSSDLRIAPHRLVHSTTDSNSLVSRISSSIATPLEEFKSSSVFRSALMHPPSILSNIDLFSLIIRVYLLSPHITTIPTFDTPEYTQAIGNIQEIRIAFEIPNDSLRKQRLSEIIHRVSPQSPKLLLMLVHYLYKINERSKNLEILEILNSPLLDTITSDTDRRSLLFSLGKPENEGTIDPEKKFPQLMTFLSEKKFPEALSFIQKEPELARFRNAYSIFVNWIKEARYEGIIPFIDSTSTSYLYNPTEHELMRNELGVFVVFDILCSRNNGEDLCNFFKAQNRNISDELYHKCLNKLIQTQRFDLASKLLESKGPPLTGLAIAFAKLDFSEILKESKIPREECTDLIKSSIIYFFINQEQFDASLILAKTTNDSIKQWVCCQFIAHSQFIYAENLLKTITSPTERTPVYLEFIKSNQNNLAFSLSLEIDDQISLINTLIQNKAHELAKDLFRRIPSNQTKASLIQSLIQAKEKESIAGQEDALGLEFEAFNPELIQIYIEAGKYEEAFNLTL